MIFTFLLFNKISKTTQLKYFSRILQSICADVGFKNSTIWVCGSRISGSKSGRERAIEREKNSSQILFWYQLKKTTQNALVADDVKVLENWFLFMLKLSGRNGGIWANYEMHEHSVFGNDAEAMKIVRAKGYVKRYCCCSWV